MVFSAIQACNAILWLDILPFFFHICDFYWFVPWQGIGEITQSVVSTVQAWDSEFDLQNPHNNIGMKWYAYYSSTEEVETKGSLGLTEQQVQPK